jgi:nucleoside-diphosphate-sugar epimerase
MLAFSVQVCYEALTQMKSVSIMTEKILITGGAGYIGGILVPLLLDKGYDVTVVDTFEHGVNTLASSCAHPGLSLERIDTRDEAKMRPMVAKADWVIPLAALVGAPICDRDPLGATSINRDAVKMIVGMLSPQQRIMFPVTNSGYGIGEPGKFCDENSPLNPISIYGRTKVEAEKAVMEHGNAVSFRLATVFGMAPRMRIDLLVNDFTYRAVRDRALVIFEGHFKRNFIHVRDVANGFLFGMNNFDRMRGEVYNLGLSEANLSKIELAEAIKTHIPKFTYLEAPIGDDPDKRDYIVSNAKLEALGWYPLHSLDMGIAELIKGYKMLRNEIYSNV